MEETGQVAIRLRKRTKPRGSTLIAVHPYGKAQQDKESFLTVQSSFSKSSGEVTHLYSKPNFSTEFDSDLTFPAPFSKPERNEEPTFWSGYELEP